MSTYPVNDGRFTECTFGRPRRSRDDVSLPPAPPRLSKTLPERPPCCRRRASLPGIWIVSNKLPLPAQEAGPQSIMIRRHIDHKGAIADVNNPQDDVVSRQYQRWRYPEPIQDLEVWHRNNWEWFDPSHASRVL